MSYWLKKKLGEYMAFSFSYYTVYILLVNLFLLFGQNTVIVHAYRTAVLTALLLSTLQTFNFKNSLC